MKLTPGTRLGPYEIESLLGAGGSFEREARTVAALNHPHICTLYDVGPNFLVMELVSGPTLAERVADHLPELCMLAA